MSGPLNNPVIEWLPVAVVSASLLGSLHCVKMCGGLMTAVTSHSKKDIAAYHIGRLLGYLTLGALAGSIGQGLFNLPWFKETVPWIAVLSIGTGLIFLGLQVWNGKSPHFALIPGTLLAKLYKLSGARPFSTGALSALLPCGWLHTYVIGALATQSVLHGALFLFAFWLGTLPAMSFAPALAQRVLTPLTRRAPKVSAVVLITAGFLSVGSKMTHHFIKGKASFENKNSSSSISTSHESSSSENESCH